MTERRLAEIKAQVRELNGRVPEFQELFDYIDQLQKENLRLQEVLIKTNEYIFSRLSQTPIDLGSVK